MTWRIPIRTSMTLVILGLGLPILGWVLLSSPDLEHVRLFDLRPMRSAERYVLSGLSFAVGAVVLNRLLLGYERITVRQYHLERVHNRWIVPIKKITPLSGIQVEGVLRNLPTNTYWSVVNYPWWWTGKTPGRFYDKVPAILVYTENGKERSIGRDLADFDADALEKALRKAKKG